LPDELHILCGQVLLDLIERKGGDLWCTSIVQLIALVYKVPACPLDTSFLPSSYPFGVLSQIGIRN
jgi:hypothetical protein